LFKKQMPSSKDLRDLYGGNDARFFLTIGGGGVALLACYQE
jgi:hypothetical protein